MAFVVSALLAAYAALAVWLAVRIINRRERWAKWALAAAGSLPMLYVVSFGPACWLDSRRKPEAKAVTVSKSLNTFYYPIINMVQRLDNDVSDKILFYAELFAADERQAQIAVLGSPGERTGVTWLIWFRRDLQAGPWLRTTPTPDE